MKSFLILLLLLAPSLVRAESYYVVGARASLPRDLAELDDLRAVFLGERLFWPDNERILAVIPDFSHSSTATFVQQILGMDHQQYTNYWRRKLFAGKGHPPKESSSEQQALLMVRDNHGGVAVLAQKPRDAKGLQVLQIDLATNRLIETAPDQQP